jgi:hypothetical protein
MRPLAALCPDRRNQQTSFLIHDDDESVDDMVVYLLSGMNEGANNAIHFVSEMDWFCITYSIYCHSDVRSKSAQMLRNMRRNFPGSQAKSLNERTTQDSGQPWSIRCVV